MEKKIKQNLTFDFKFAYTHSFIIGFPAKWKNSANGVFFHIPSLEKTRKITIYFRVIPRKFMTGKMAE